MPHGLRLSAPHVLVVQADARSREAVAAMLAADGARVTTAASAREAVRRVTARRFHAAVVDYALPGSDGVVVVAEIRSLGNGRDLPVVMLHGMPAGAALERASERVASLPCVAFLDRRLTAPALASAVNRLTSAARMEV